MHILLAFVLLSLAFAQDADKDGIVTLTEKNFHDVIHANKNVFVFFHSAWDTRSKGFEYEWRIIARRGQREGIPVVFAKINLPVNRAIAEIYRTRVYPSLHLFIDGSDEFYNDALNENDIIFYLQKKLMDKIVTITSSKEVLAHLDQGRPVFVGHFRTNTNLKYKYFSEIAKDFDDVDTLCAFGDAEVEEPMDSFTVYNADGIPFPYTGKWEKDAMKEFMVIHALPLIIPYRTRWNRFIFSSAHSIRKELVYLSADDEPVRNSELRSILETLARKHQGEVFVVSMDPGDNMMEYFGFDMDQLPLFFLMEMEKQPWKKYVFHGEQNLEEMDHFYTEAVSGALYPYYKSEPVYEHLDGFVKVIVSKDFDDVAYDPYKNVLVEFVVPGCRMCDRVEDDYQRLAEAYINTDDVVIARVDSSKNDIHDISIGDFPTFILYKAGGDGEKSVVFSNDQKDFPRLKKFVETYKTIAPKRPAKKVEEKVEENVEEKVEKVEKVEENVEEKVEEKVEKVEENVEEKVEEKMEDTPEEKVEEKAEEKVEDTPEEKVEDAPEDKPVTSQEKEEEEL